MTTDTGTLPDTRVFPAWARCDACPAQAQTRILLPAGGVLELCGHHTRQHAAALTAHGAQLLFDTPQTFT